MEIVYQQLLLVFLKKNRCPLLAWNKDKSYEWASLYITCSLRS